MIGDISVSFFIILSISVICIYIIDKVIIIPNNRKHNMKLLFEANKCNSIQELQAKLDGKEA
jgi:hypothetical protein